MQTPGRSVFVLCTDQSLVALLSAKLTRKGVRVRVGSTWHECADEDVAAVVVEPGHEEDIRMLRLHGACQVFVLHPHADRTDESLIPLSPSGIKEVCRRVAIYERVGSQHSADDSGEV